MIDWEAAGREVTGYLQGLIRIDTTNPPGNETAAARYLAGILERQGIAPAVTESAPGRGNVTGRLRGGSAAPLLLGHTDVVGVEAARWTHPPFGGELVDGYVWGRSALDMKCMVAAELMVLLLLKRQGATLRRSVLFAATADEEVGEGGHGIGWLLDHHPEQVDAPVVLTEGGGSHLCVNGQRYYTCQVGQKGTCRLRVRAGGSPGHGSMPPRRQRRGAAVPRPGRAGRGPPADPRVRR
ncbi:MAG: M20/M25/M40 family metallo-hydrolase, partial [Gemmatimonadota bacterium]